MHCAKSNRPNLSTILCENSCYGCSMNAVCIWKQLFNLNDSFINGFHLSIQDIEILTQLQGIFNILLLPRKNLFWDAMDVLSTMAIFKHQ